MIRSSHRLAARAIRWLLAAIAVAALSGSPAWAQAKASSSSSSPEIRLLLNLPGNRLYVYEDGQVVRRYRVAIGMEGYETPPGTYRVTHAIWNPWWHPPKSDWARDRKVEPPGSPENPMGRIKLHFAELLYIHGTPEEETVGWQVSRGCVRMANHEVIELSRYLHEHFAPQVTGAQIDRLVDDPKRTQEVRFRRSIPFEVVYRVTEVRDGFLFIFPDVYGLSKGELESQVTTELEENGVDMSRVNREKLDRLLRKGVDMRVAMSLDTLVAGPTGAGSDMQR